MTTGVSSSSSTSQLYAYRSTKHKLLVAASLLIPFGTVLIFVLYCVSEGGEYALNSVVDIDGTIRTFLIIHGLYFMALPFSFELMINTLPMIGCPEEYRFGRVPPRPDNLYWMMSCLSGELFFVGAVALLLLASQDSAPRWTLIIPIAQCAYNMKNDLLWVGFGNTFSPIGKRMTIMVLDWILIGVCFVVYINHFCTATAVAAKVSQ